MILDLVLQLSPDKMNNHAAFPLAAWYQLSMKNFTTKLNFKSKAKYNQLVQNEKLHASETLDIPRVKPSNLPQSQHMFLHVLPFDPLWFGQFA